MSNKYFWVPTIIIVVLLLLLVWNTCVKKYINQHYEGFDQPKWEKTLKCLKFTNEDINKFKNNLLKGEEPKTMLNKLMVMAHRKKLNDKQIFECLTGDV